MHFSLLFEDRLFRANPAEVAALDFDRWTSEDRKQVVVVGLDLVLVHQTGGSLQGDESLRIATCSIHKFIHSGHFYSASSSPLPLRGAPDTARILCRSFTPKRHRQLRDKDLPKVPTWRLERDSNPRPSGRKASTLPMCHHVPQNSCLFC